MIKHIVMWKLKEEAEGKTKAENALELKKRLEALKAEIVEIKEIEVGLNICDSDQAYDVVLNSVFEDEASLERYQKHPKHLAVGSFIGKIREERVVVDYQL